MFKKKEFYTIVEQAQDAMQRFGQFIQSSLNGRLSTRTARV